VDAISTDDTILAGMAAQDPYAKVLDERYTEEPYGMAISKKHPEFTRFVNAVLAKAKQDGTWASTYKKWLGGTAPQPPVAQYK
jgi:polar amino acid transport system substrate-binding protein